MALEQEVKLAYDSLEAAGRSVVEAGGRLVIPRRLLDDRLFDTPNRELRIARSSLRLRRDGDHALITYKGPVQPGPVKIREELETRLADAHIGEAILKGLGYEQVFRSEKYRAEYVLDSTQIAVDETPMGVFVEIEGAIDHIERVTIRLGRSPNDYRLESYQRLHADWCAARGRFAGDMTF